MPVKEPQIIDYLLSGLAGIGKGVVAGTAQRQERERQEDIQAALDEYRRSTLDLQKRQGMQQQARWTFEQMIGKPRAAKQAQKFKIELMEKGTEEAKELAKFEKGLETGDGFLSKLLGGMTPRDFALMQKDVAQTKLYNAQAESKTLETQLEKDQKSLPWQEFGNKKVQDALDREMKWSELNLSLQNQQAVAMYKAANDMLARRDFVPLHAEMSMRNLQYLRWNAFINPLADKDEKKDSVKEYNSASKKFSSWLLKNMGVTHDFGTLEFEDPFWSGPKVKELIPATPGEYPSALPPWPGPTGVTPKEDGGFDIQSGLPDFLKFFGQEQQQQAPPAAKAKTDVDVTRVIIIYKEQGKLGLSGVDIDNLENMGFSEGQINKINEEILKGVPGDDLPAFDILEGMPTRESLE